MRSFPGHFRHLSTFGFAMPLERHTQVYPNSQSRSVRKAASQDVFCPEAASTVPSDRRPRSPGTHGIHVTHFANVKTSLVFICTVKRRLLSRTQGNPAQFRSASVRHSSVVPGVLQTQHDGAYILLVDRSVYLELELAPGVCRRSVGEPTYHPSLPSTSTTSSQRFLSPGVGDIPRTTC